MSHERRKNRHMTRREMLVGATALSMGVFLSLAGVGVAERLASERNHPLTPENGSAESHLAVAWLPSSVKRWQSKIEQQSAAYAIDPNLVAIMMTVESGGDPAADSGVAKGLMQITEPTAQDIAHRILKTKRDTYDLHNPDTSIEFGAAYIRYLIDQVGDASQGPSWDETVTLVAAGYNGGLSAAKSYQQHGWQGLEEYDKDQQAFRYARYVHVMWQERHDPLSFAYRNWYEAGNGKALIDQAQNLRAK